MLKFKTRTKANFLMDPKHNHQIQLHNISYLGLKLYLSLSMILQFRRFLKVLVNNLPQSSAKITFLFRKPTQAE